MRWKRELKREGEPQDCWIVRYLVVVDDVDLGRTGHTLDDEAKTKCDTETHPWYESGKTRSYSSS